ncbi:MAG: PTS sugar transporter subunit IIA [Pseudomonadota bacterium]
MDVTGLLSPKAVKVVSGHSSKKRLFSDIAALVRDAYDLNCDSVVDALLERETLGPTGVGHGVALPHARIDGLDTVIGAFVKLERPVDFSAADRQPVDLVFCLLASQKAGVDHLKALAVVSRTLRDSGICDKLRANADPGTLHTILTEKQTIQAA